MVVEKVLVYIKVESYLHKLDLKAATVTAHMYRVTMGLCNYGLAGAGGKLADLAEQVSKVAEHPN